MFSYNGTKMDISRTSYNVQGVQKHQFIPSYGEKEAVYMAFVNYGDFGIKIVKIYGEEQTLGIVRHTEIAESSSRIKDLVCHENACAVTTDSQIIFYLDFKTAEDTKGKKMLVLSSHKVWALPSHSHTYNVDVTPGMIAFSSSRTTLSGYVGLLSLKYGNGVFTSTRLIDGSFCLLPSKESGKLARLMVVDEEYSDVNLFTIQPQRLSLKKNFSEKEIQGVASIYIVTDNLKTLTVPLVYFFYEPDEHK